MSGKMCWVPLDGKLPDGSPFLKAEIKRDYMVDDLKCNNDDARSMTICRAIKGTQITVFDDGDLKTDDDYATITVDKDLKGCVNIGTFEKSTSYGDWSGMVKVNYHSVNGLDGKVSSFSIGEMSQLDMEFLIIKVSR